MTTQAPPKAPQLANDFYAPLKARAAEIEDRYRALTPKSASLFEHAKEVYPGGYTRDAIIRKPYAPFVSKGHGTQLIDSDGRAITDFWFNATSLPIGHAHERVVEAVTRQAQEGSAYFAFTETELDLAEKICARLPSAERVRFTNSGSEAVMVAVRMARAATGRDLLVKFEGSYHGTYDDVYWSVGPPADKVGDPDRPTPVPDTGGLPSGEGRVLVLPYNNPAALREAMAERGGDVAAVIVEPMANRIGLVLPDV
jgi:glutamate-1-semialdehyde 2,1-aminomutase